MKRIRVIPVLLIQNGGLVKSIRFSNYRYVGDPINAVRIFNEKEVDEIIILDISATSQKRGPDLELVRSVANECFMPMAYGGGITQVEEIESLINLGVEKVIINSAVLNDTTLIRKSSQKIGSQSIVVCIDIKKNWRRKFEIYSHLTKRKTSVDLNSFVKIMEEQGCGELILQSVDNDGVCCGYDHSLIEAVSQAVSIPVVALGGAWQLADLKSAIEAGASAVAAGSMFVFHGKHKAVLISYPSQELLKNELYTNE